MISIKEQVVTSLTELSEAQLQTVAEFLEFLKFRERYKIEWQYDESELEVLYGEFSDEDRELAEAGLAEYASGLEREDSI
jgi:hypothetical protein